MSVSPHTPADTPPSSSLLLLDGGTGHLLKEWGVRLPGLPIKQQFLAGVLANESDPHVVQRVHSTYIAAGSRCITTNSFVATRHSLAKLGRKGDVGMLAAAAARNAAAAREGSGVAGVLVAGSLPPLQERCANYLLLQEGNAVLLIERVQARNSSGSGGDIATGYASSLATAMTGILLACSFQSA